ncbi:hypothetical protein VTO42DRAFT_2634 [Malbranchea cinnamomea]
MELNQGNSELFTPEQLISQIDAAFDDPNHRVHAAVKLRQIRQSNRPYCEFITDFEGKLLAANSFAWDDYRDAIGDAAVSLERFRPSRPSCTPGKAHFHPLSSHPTPAPVFAAVPIAGCDPNTMDWEPTSSNARAKWVSEAEKERRKKERLCIRCGASGHFIRKCPYHSAANPVPHACTAGVSPPVIVLPMLDDAESRAEEEQRKE